MYLTLLAPPGPFFYISFVFLKAFNFFKMPPRRAVKSKKALALKTRRMGGCNSRQRKTLRRFVCISPESSEDENEPHSVELETLNVATQEVPVVPVEENSLQQNSDGCDDNNNEADVDGSLSDSSMDSLHLTSLWVEGQGSRDDSSSHTPEAEVFEKFAIPKAPFKRLSKQILNEARPGWRLRAVALEALQVAAEGYITGLFSGCSSSCAVRKSSTIKVEDMRLVLSIQECMKRPLGSRLRRPNLREEAVPSRNRVFSSSTDETNEG